MSIARVFAVTCLLALPLQAWAAGQPDPTFGTGGSVTAPLDGFLASANGPDGRLIAVGPGFMTRLLPDGTPDPTFGPDGLVLAPPVSTQATGLSFQDVVVGSDGRLVVMGRKLTYVPIHSFGAAGMVARYEEDGAVDGSFAGVGHVALANPYGNFIDTAPLVEPDGDVFVTSYDLQNGFVSRLWRLRADGVPDATFGPGGNQPFQLAGQAQEVTDNLLLPDGRILLLVSRVIFPTPESVAFVRLGLDGERDATFGFQGVVVPPLTERYPAAMARQADGKLVVAGWKSAPGGERRAWLARFSAAGVLDPTFGSGGVVDTPQAGNAFFTTVVATPDGRIVAAGAVGSPGWVNNDLLLVGYRSNGAIDPSFGVGGLVVDATQEAVRDLTLQPDGKLVTAAGRLTRWLMDDTPTCTATPRASCRTPTLPGKSTLRLRDGAQDTLAWTWTKGDALGDAELGNPIASTGYALCVYDGTSALVATLRAPSGGTCDGRPCWAGLGAHGFRRTDRSGASDGVTALRVQAGAAGTAKALVKAKGAALPTPALPLALPVRVQLQASNGTCLGATFTSASRNADGRFQGKSD